jgi:hypothetical protein
VISLDLVDELGGLRRQVGNAGLLHERADIRRGSGERCGRSRARFSRGDITSGLQSVDCLIYAERFGKEACRLDPGAAVAAHHGFVGHPASEAHLLALEVESAEALRPCHALASAGSSPGFFGRPGPGARRSRHTER